MLELVYATTHISIHIVVSYSFAFPFFYLSDKSTFLSMLNKQEAPLLLCLLKK